MHELIHGVLPDWASARAWPSMYASDLLVLFPVCPGQHPVIYESSSVDANQRGVLGRRSSGCTILPGWYPFWPGAGLARLPLAWIRHAFRLSDHKSAGGAAPISLFLVNNICRCYQHEQHAWCARELQNAEHISSGSLFSFCTIQHFVRSTSTRYQSINFFLPLYILLSWPQWVEYRSAFQSIMQPTIAL